MFFWLVTIQTQWCDQHIRVIQFVEKLPNEYQTTVRSVEVATAQQAKAPTLYTRWFFQTEDATCIYIYNIYIEIHYEITLLRKKYQKLSTTFWFSRNQKAMASPSAFLRRLHEAWYELHLASTEFLKTARGSCRTSRESYEPKMRWKIPFDYPPSFHWKLLTYLEPVCFLFWELNTPKEGHFGSSHSIYIYTLDIQIWEYYAYMIDPPKPPASAHLEEEKHRPKPSFIVRSMLFFSGA